MPYKGNITFVANNNTMGDGENPSTMDRPMFGGDDTQYPWLSLAIPKLRKMGYNTEVVSWQDESIDWKKKEFVVIGPVWGYSKEQDKFDGWLNRMEQENIKIQNSVGFIKWNFKKTYLEDLQSDGINVPPTKIVPSDSKETLAQVLDSVESSWGTRDVVIKGVVDAAAFGYSHIKPDNEQLEENNFNKLKKDNNGVVVQQFLPEIGAKGELSMVFFRDKLSHSFLKVPKAGEERVQVFYGGKSFHIQQANIKESLDKIKEEHRPDIEIIPQDIEGAQQQAKELKSKLNKILEKKNISLPLYTRIDGAIVNDKFLIMEIEGLEPYMEMQEAMTNDPSNDVISEYTNAIEASYKEKKFSRSEHTGMIRPQEYAQREKAKEVHYR